MKIKKKIMRRWKQKSHLQVKRPLCAAALIWAAVLWLLGKAGVLALGFNPPGLPGGADKSNVLVTGILYKTEYGSVKSNLYLNHANLILESKKYPIDNLKIIIETEKLPKEAVNGCEAAVWGSLQEIPPASNPGQFSPRAYYYVQNVKWYQEAFRLKVLKKNHSRIRRLQETAKQNVRRGIEKIMNPEDAGILEAMLLGDRKNMEETDKHLFQIMGISHILAVSGLHIAVFGWGLFKILRRMRCSVKNAGLVSCAGIFFYGGMTGNSAAAVRAAVMFAMSVGALASGRTYDFLSAVSLAAILILVQRPLYLYDSGFLLSFGAVLGLGMVCPDLFPKEEIRKEGFLQKSLHGGISVWLTTLPVTLYFFFEIPVFGILINILVLPLAGLLLGAGALGGLLGMFLPAVFGKTAAYPAIFLLRIFRKAGELLSRLPWAMWSFGKPALWKCGMYYVFLCAALIWKGKYPRCFKRMVILAGMLVLFLKLPRKGMEVTFLDVGQGDCACIQTEAGSCFLVDGGSLDVPKVGKYRILPFLKASGIGTVEGVFISHMDEDHVNGIRELLEMIINRETGLKINRLFLSLCSETEKDRKELEKLGKRAGCEIVHVEKGTVLREKETVMECLSPSGAFSDSNAGSQVLLVSDRSFHILFTGDVEGQGEAELTKTLKRKGKTGIDVLKIAHHGSKNSTGEAFLQQAKPAAAVISCGKENRYGHPHRELLERLEKEKIHIVKTPDCGAICVSAFRKKVQISFQYRRIMVQ